MKPGCTLPLEYGRMFAHELVMDRAQFGRRNRKLARENARARVRHRLPHRTLADVLQVVEHVVQHAVPLGAKRTANPRDRAKQRCFATSRDLMVHPDLVDAGT